MNEIIFDLEKLQMGWNIDPIYELYKNQATNPETRLGGVTNESAFELQPFKNSIYLNEATPRNYTNAEARKALNQSTIDYIGKSIWNTGVEATVGTVKALTDLPDILFKYIPDREGSMVKMANGTFENDASKFFGNLSKSLKGEIYSTAEEGSFWDTVIRGVGDGSIGSAVSSLLPGIAVAKAGTMTSKLISAPLLAMSKNVAKTINTADKSIDTYKGLNTISQTSKFDNVVGTLTGAIYSNMWESVGSMVQTLPELKAKMQGKINPATNKVFTDQEINKALVEEGKKIYTNNLWNVIPEALGIHSIIKPRAGFLGKGTRDYGSKSILNNSYLTEAGTEYFQEIQNTYSEETAKRNIDIKLGLKNKEYTWVENFFNPQAQGAGILGALGAGVSVKAGGLLSSKEPSELIEGQKKDLAELQGYKKKLDKEFVNGEQILTAAQKTNNQNLVNNAEKELSINRASRSMANGTFGVYLDTLDKSIQIAESLEQDNILLPEKQSKLDSMANDINSNLQSQGIEASIDDIINAKEGEELFQYKDQIPQEYQTLKQELSIDPNVDENKTTISKLKKLKEDALKLEKHYIRASDKYGLGGLNALEFARIATELEDLDAKISNSEAYKTNLIEQDEEGNLKINSNKKIDALVKQKEKALASYTNKLIEEGFDVNKLLKDLSVEPIDEIKQLRNLKLEIEGLNKALDVDKRKEKIKEFRTKKEKLKEKKKIIFELQSKEEIEYYYNQEIAKLSEGLSDTELNLVNKSDITIANLALQRNEVKRKLDNLINKKESSLSAKETSTSKFEDEVNLIYNQQALKPLIDEINKNELPNLINKATNIEEIISYIDDYDNTPFIKSLLIGDSTQGGEGGKIELLLDELNNLVNREDIRIIIDEYIANGYSEEEAIEELQYNDEYKTLADNLTNFIEQVKELSLELDSAPEKVKTNKTKNQIANELIRDKVSSIKDNLDSLPEDYSDITDLLKILAKINDIENIINNSSFDIKYPKDKIDAIKSSISEKINKANEILKKLEKDEIEKYNKFLNWYGKILGKDITFEDLSKLTKENFTKINEYFNIQKVEDVLNELKTKLKLQGDINLSKILNAIYSNFSLSEVNRYDLLSKYEVTQELINKAKEKSVTPQFIEALVLLMENKDTIMQYELHNSIDYDIIGKVLEIEKKLFNKDITPFPEQLLAIRLIAITKGNTYLQGLAGTGKSKVVLKYAIDIIKELNSANVIGVAKGEEANNIISTVLGNPSKIDHFIENTVSQSFLDTLSNLSSNEQHILVIDEAPKLQSPQIDAINKALEGKDNVRIIYTGDPNQLTTTSINSVFKSSNILIIPPLLNQKRSGNSNIVNFQEEFIRNPTQSIIDKHFTQLNETIDDIPVAGVKAFANTQDMMNDIQKKEGESTVIITDYPEKYANSKVKVMSVSDSQGLEFDNVYLDLKYGEEELMSSIMYDNKKMYVAASRAKKFLGIIHPKLNKDFINNASTPFVEVKATDDRFKNNKQWYDELVKSKDTKPEENKEDATSVKKDVDFVYEQNPATTEEEISEEPEEYPTEEYIDNTINENNSQEVIDKKLDEINSDNNISAKTNGIKDTELKPNDVVYAVTKRNLEGKDVNVFVARNPKDGKFYEVGQSNDIINSELLFTQTEINNGISDEKNIANILNSRSFEVKKVNPFTIVFGNTRPMSEEVLNEIKQKYEKIYPNKDVIVSVVVAEKKDGNISAIPLQKGATYIKIEIQGNDKAQYISVKGKKLNSENEDFKLLKEEFDAVFEIENELQKLKFNDFLWGSNEGSSIGGIGKDGKPFRVSKGEMFNTLINVISNPEIKFNSEVGKQKKAMIDNLVTLLDDITKEKLKRFQRQLFNYETQNDFGIAIDKATGAKIEENKLITIEEFNKDKKDSEKKTKLNSINENGKTKVFNKKELEKNKSLHTLVNPYLDNEGGIWELIQRSDRSGEIVLRQTYELYPNNDENKIAYHVKIDYPIINIDGEYSISKEPNVAIFTFNEENSDRFERKYRKNNNDRGNIKFDSRNQNSKYIIPEDGDIKNTEEIKKRVKLLIETGKDVDGNEVKLVKKGGVLQQAFARIAKANSKVYLDDKGSYISLRENTEAGTKSVSLYNNALKRTAIVNGNLIEGVSPRDVIKGVLQTDSNGESNANRGFGLRTPIDKKDIKLDKLETDFQDVYNSYLELVIPEKETKKEIKTPKLSTVKVDLSALSIPELENVAKQLRQKAVNAREAEKEGKTILGGSAFIESDYQVVKDYIEKLKETPVDIKLEIKNSIINDDKSSNNISQYDDINAIMNSNMTNKQKKEELSEIYEDLLTEYSDITKIAEIDKILNLDIFKDSDDPQDVC